MKKILSLIYKILLVVWLLGIFMFGAWFVNDNPQQMQLALFGFKLPETSTAAYIMITLIAGTCMGSIFTFTVMQKRLFAKQRQLKKVRKEADKLKAINTLPDAASVAVTS
ncbi:MAG: hypothetical protein KTR17_06420 [Cellvibrionaceae bacterium]|nr:hypothetical protein [Cellvibrionaceae bacterium]